MPKNRLPVDREQKRAEIVTVARRLFLRDGYEATPMSRLAKEAGIAPNTIYWYFEDKDALLVAVLDAELTDGLHAYEGVAEKRAIDRALWLLGRLEQAARLVSTVHERALQSPRVNAWHERFHQAGEAMICAELSRRGVPPARREASAKIWAFTLEGLLAHPLDPKKKRQILQTLLSTLPGSPASKTARSA